MSDTLGFGPLLKAAETFEGLRISGVATDGRVVDCDRERFDYWASKPYFEAYRDEMRRVSGGKNEWPIRLQHDSTKPVGKVTAMILDDAAEQVRIEGVVYDPLAAQMIEEGVLTMLSIGGTKVAARREVDESGQAVVWFTARPLEVAWWIEAAARPAS
jgi:hypothetical protein